MHSNSKVTGTNSRLTPNQESLLSRIKASADDLSQVNTLVQEAQQLIRKRQKLIQIVDHRKDGWLGVHEYESDDLTSNFEDQKSLTKAKSAAEKKRKNPERQKLGSPQCFKSDNGNQLFRCTILFFIYFSLLFLTWLECLNIQHQIAWFVLYILHSRGK